jgi:hypothetical protein
MAKKQTPHFEGGRLIALPEEAESQGTRWEKKKWHIQNSLTPAEKNDLIQVPLLQKII